MTRHISYDNEGNMYLEDIPGMSIEDKDLTDEEIAEKYNLVKPENTEDPEYENWREPEPEESVEEDPNEVHWVEEYQNKNLEDIFAYLEVHNKLINGSMHKIVIEKSMYEDDKYDFKWQ